MQATTSAIEFLLNYVKRFGDGEHAPQAAKHLAAVKEEWADFSAPEPEAPTDPTTDADLKAQGIFPPADLPKVDVPDEPKTLDEPKAPEVPVTK